MKQSLFYEFEKSLGAKFEIQTVAGAEESDAWEIAARFSTLEEECAAVRSAVGLMDFSHRGKIELSGPDRVRYLNGQVTNDVQKLAVGQGCYACVLNHKGAMLGDLKIYALPDLLLMDTPQVCTQKLVSHFNRFAISDQVEILDRTVDFAHLGIHGPRSLELLKSFTGEDFSRLAEYAHQPVRAGALRIVRQNYTGEMGFDLFFEKNLAPELWKEILECGKLLGLKCVGAQAFNVLRVEAGVPLYGIDMTEDHLPLEANLTSAISTDKGCYVGQEVVARIIYRGHVNRLLSGFRIRGSEAPRPGQKLFKEDKAVGEITSVVDSPTLQQKIALGYLHPLHAQPGHHFSIGAAGTAADAEAMPLPFYRSSTSL